MRLLCWLGRFRDWSLVLELFDGWMHRRSPGVELRTQFFDDVRMLVGKILLFSDICHQIVKSPCRRAHARINFFIQSYEFPVSLPYGGVVNLRSGDDKTALLSGKPTPVLPAEPLVRIRFVFAFDEGKQVDTVCWLVARHRQARRFDQCGK